MWSLFQKVWEILPANLRPKVLWYIPLATLSSLLELGGFVAALPFLSLLVDPSLLEKNFYLSRLHHWSGLEASSLLTVLGIVVTLAFVLRDIFAAWLTWYQAKVQADIRCGLGERLMWGYLYQPYVWYLGRQASDLRQNVGRLNQVVLGLLQPLAGITSSLIRTILFCALLFWAQPFVSLVLVGVLAMFYAALHLMMLPHLKKRSLESRELFKAQYRASGDAFEGFKEAKLLGCERFYYQAYATQSRATANNQVWQQLSGRLPRYLTRTLFTLVLAVVALWVLHNNPGGANLAKIAIYFTVAARVAMGLQTILQSVTTARNSEASVEELYEDLRGQSESSNRFEPQPVAQKLFAKSVRFDKVNFTYPGAKKEVIRNLNFELKKGTMTALVGVTGAGKSTLLDLLSGLLHPDSGQVLIDGEPLADDGRAWRANLGYCLQENYFLNDSVLKNIALGQSTDVDEESVQRALRLACLAEHVSSLPEGLQTVVGERGRRFSKGQAQRLGVARALYQEPALLIFDEATSALDVKTEAQILENLRGLTPQKTLLLVTHRVSTARLCDQILVIDGGELIGQGTFLELMETCPQFSELVTIARAR